MARYWRFYCTSVYGGRNVSLIELEFLDSLGVNRALNKPFTYSSYFTEDGPVNHHPRNAFDGVKTTNDSNDHILTWASATDAIPAWLAVDLEDDVDITSVELTYRWRTDSLNQSPRAFVIQKSDDNSNWEDVWSVNDQSSMPGRNERRTFFSPNANFTAKIEDRSPPSNSTTLLTETEELLTTTIVNQNYKYINRGNGFISGRILEKTTPTKLTLVETNSRRVIKEVLADNIGQYSFDNIDHRLKYDVIATDVATEWESKVSSRRDPVYVPPVFNIVISGLDGSEVKLDLETEHYFIYPNFSQSTSRSNDHIVSYDKMYDDDENTFALTSTPNGEIPWIMADMGTRVTIDSVLLSSAVWSGFGNLINWVNGSRLEYSDDSFNWSVALTVEGVQPTGKLPFVLDTPTAARWWRLSNPQPASNVATGTFRFEGMAKKLDYVFEYTGNQEYLTVPDGVNRAMFTLVGASGGGGNYSWNHVSGAGAYAHGLMEVEPGQMFVVRVGQGGEGGHRGERAGAGGWPGGGSGSRGDVGCGGGGGYTGVFLGDETPLIIAGAGGGSSSYANPAGAGGADVGGFSGEAQGGTQSWGGANQYDAYDTPTFAIRTGGYLQGGSANNGDMTTYVGDDSAGGGAGYYGGAAGTGDGRSGAGGSSFINQKYMVGKTYAGSGGSTPPAKPKFIGSRDITTVGTGVPSRGDYTRAERGRDGLVMVEFYYDEAPLQFPTVRPIYTMSSRWREGMPATFDNMNTADFTTGAGTHGSGGSLPYPEGPQWIEADLIKPHIVTSVEISGGSLFTEPPNRINWTGGPGTAGYLNGRLLQYSTDRINWETIATVEVNNNSITAYDVTGIEAQYWRLYSPTTFVATNLFRFSYGVPGEIYSVYTMSSKYAPTTGVSRAKMTDGNMQTGAGTNNVTSSREWIMADHGKPVAVSKVTLGAGYVPDWGTTYQYFNACSVEYSNDLDTWTTAFECGEFTDNQIKTFDIEPPITARYWRLAANGWVGATEFSFTFPANPVDLITYSQSSNYPDVPNVTHTAMNDYDNNTGAGTNYVGGADAPPEWIMATLPEPMVCAEIHIGSGVIPGWGSTQAYLDGAMIQCSTDGVNWTDAIEINPGYAVDGETMTFGIDGFNVQRYWRVINFNTYVGLTEFRLVPLAAA